MKLNKDILCLQCKGCGDIEVNTTISADPKTGNVTKTTILGGIWCDKQEDKIEPRFCCPCYEPEPDNLEEEDLPEYASNLVFFQADEETCRRISTIAQQNNLSAGELITRLINTMYPEEKND